MIRPRLGARKCVSRLKQVVLPAPFGPISACIVPRRTRRLTSLTATNPLNSLVRPSVSRMRSSAIRFAGEGFCLSPIGRTFLNERRNAFLRRIAQHVVRDVRRRDLICVSYRLLELGIKKCLAGGHHLRCLLYTSDAADE